MLDSAKQIIKCRNCGSLCTYELVELHEGHTEFCCQPIAQFTGAEVEAILRKFIDYGNSEDKHTINIIAKCVRILETGNEPSKRRKE